MKLTGRVGQSDRQTSRTSASRETPHPTFQPGTALPGPALTSGPGVFLSARPKKSACKVVKFVPQAQSFLSYFIPAERRPHWTRTKERVP